jgi:zinc/manganese transport system permease protein
VTAFIDLLGPAVLVIVLLVAIHTLFGLHVLRRNIVFIDLALAQMAGLGATVAFSIGYAPLSPTSYAYAFAFTLAGALLLSGLRFLPKHIPHEALIGILYVVAAAATILFIEKSPQGAEHLKQLLTGNIVTIDYNDAVRLLPLYAGIGVAIVFIAARGGFARTGTAGWFFDLLFYTMFGAVVTSSVAIAGVLLVFSFLIVPACIGFLLADSALRQWLLGTAFGIAAGAAGLTLSYFNDYSAGAAVVCAFGATLALTGAIKIGIHANRLGAGSRYFRGAAVASAAILLASALWSFAAPRSDHPLLNSVEAVLPFARTLYLNDGERQLIAESAVYAERYRAEAERLNRLEQDDRAGGNLSDEKIAKIASFIKAYNEMRSGETFVAKETIARARIRNRIGLWAAQFGVGLMLLWAALRGTGFLSAARQKLLAGYGARSGPDSHALRVPQE